MFKRIQLISISVTHRCNLNCKMCWQTSFRNSEKAQQDLSYENFNILLNKLELLAPNNIYLWGGEPLIHPNIIEMIRKVKDYKFICHLITNGVMLEELADDLINAKLDRLSVSIDGVGDQHDLIRGRKGVFEKTEKGLLKLLSKKKFRPITSVNTVITDKNYRDLYSIVKYFSSFGVNGIQLQFPVFFDEAVGEATGRYLQEKFQLCISSWKGFVNSYNTIDVDELDGIIQNIRKDFPKVSFYPSDLTAKEWFSKESISRPIKCCVPWQRVNIEPNGDLNICTDYSDMVVGNLFEDTLQEVWESNRYQKFRSEIESENYLPICKHCTYAYINWKSR